MKIPGLTAAIALLTAIVSSTAAGQSPLEVSGVPAKAPVRVTASASGEFLLVDLQFEPEWHAYSRDVGGGQPVRLTLDAASDFAADGDVDMPADEAGKLAGAVRLSLPIRQTGEGRALRATLDVQVCDALMCLPPMSITVSGTVDAVSVLLVVAEVTQREERIAAWLRARGFEVETVTYATATRDACDASDVVLCDSQLFREDNVKREVVHAFPKTETPIVAVGYLGTELVEAHGLAMTSGYI